MPTVLDRPHALVVELASPAHRGQMTGLVGRDFQAATHSAGGTSVPVVPMCDQ
jgi:hypothetical protein